MLISLFNNASDRIDGLGLSPNIGLNKELVLIADVASSLEKAMNIV